MKKIFALLLCFALVLSFGSAHAFAEVGAGGSVYKQLFEERYTSADLRLYDYRELYRQNDSQGDTGRMLIYATVDMFGQEPVSFTVGNRVIEHSEHCAPFSSGYVIYDVKTDAFYDACRIDLSYPDGIGFLKACDQSISEGRLLGDVDLDDEISVIDITQLQRCQAGMCEYSTDDMVAADEDSWIGSAFPKYYSDFNRDGERDILDATCMQRYLAGMKYPIG